MSSQNQKCCTTSTLIKCQVSFGATQPTSSELSCAQAFTAFLTSGRSGEFSNQEVTTRGCVTRGKHGFCRHTQAPRAGFSCLPNCFQEACSRGSDTPLDGAKRGRPTHEGCHLFLAQNPCLPPPLVLPPLRMQQRLPDSRVAIKCEQLASVSWHRQPACRPWSRAEGPLVFKDTVHYTGARRTRRKNPTGASFCSPRTKMFLAGRILQCRTAGFASGTS